LTASKVQVRFSLDADSRSLSSSSPSSSRDERVGGSAWLELTA
jgi:hypothetical protein